MQIVVLADANQKEELVNNNPSLNAIWITDEHEFVHHKNADAFFDLTFENTDKRRSLLAQLLPKLVVINSVADTLKEIHLSFVRINGWKTFLSSSLIEAACYDEHAKLKAEEAFSLFNKKIEWLADEPGFITARVVSMIINEAFILLVEGVSTKEEINTAMKLGTAYPFGPFEWAEKIGLKNIILLLEKLSETQSRYKPSEFLLQEASKII